MFKMYHIVERVLKYNTQIVERGKFETPYKHLHNRSLSWLHTIFNESCGSMLVLWIQTSFLNEMVQGHDFGV